MKYTHKVIYPRLKPPKNPDPVRYSHPTIRITNRCFRYKSTALSDDNYAAHHKPCIVYAEEVNPKKQMYKVYNHATEITYKDLKYIRQPYGGHILPLDLLMHLPISKETLKEKENYSNNEVIDILWHQYNVAVNILHGIDVHNLRELLPSEILPILRLSSREKVSLVNYLEELSKTINILCLSADKKKQGKTYTSEEILKLLQLDLSIPNLGRSSYTIHKYLLKLDSFLLSLIDGRHFVVHLI